MVEVLRSNSSVQYCMETKHNNFFSDCILPFTTCSSFIDQCILSVPKWLQLLKNKDKIKIAAGRTVVLNLVHSLCTYLCPSLYCLFTF